MKRCRGGCGTLVQGRFCDPCRRRLKGVEEGKEYDAEEVRLEVRTYKPPWVAMAEKNRKREDERIDDPLPR